MDGYTFPDELNFEKLSRMYPSVKTEYRKQPFSTSQTTGYAGNQQIQVMLHKSDRSFANPATTCLRFQLNVTVGVPAAGATAGSGASGVFLMGCAWSVFSRFVSKQNGGNDIDQIDWPGRLVNTITNITLNSEEKRGMVSMGFNDFSGYNNVGWSGISAADITAGNSVTYNVTFCIPLIGAFNATKLIPLFAGDLEFNFTVASAASDFLYTNGGGLVVQSYSVTNVELVTEILTIEDTGFKLLLAQYPNVVNIKTQSYAYNSPPSLQSADGGGTRDIIIPFSLNSMKQFIWWVSPGNAWDGNYGGVNPNLNTWNLVIGSTSYPQQPVKCDSVSEVYYQNSKSFGAFYAASHSGSCVRLNMNKASTAGGEYVAYNTTNPAVGTLNTGASVANVSCSNKFYNVLDLETINQLKNTMYSGIPTRGSTNTLRLNIARQLAAQIHYIHMYACYDVLLNFDYVSGKISYSN